MEHDAKVQCTVKLDFQDPEGPEVIARALKAIQKVPCALEEQPKVEGVISKR